MTGGGSAGHDVLKGIGVDAHEAPAAADNGAAEALPGPPPRLSIAELERRHKEQEKAVKKADKKVSVACHSSYMTLVAVTSRGEVLQ